MVNQAFSSGAAGAAPVVCTVDVVLFTLVQSRLHVVLLRRKHAPFAGRWALPGGFIHAADDADAAASAARVLRDKVGIEGAYLEQLATFSGASRDPRGWSLAVVFCALVPPQAVPARAALFTCPVDGLPGLPFDHANIVAAALARVRNKSLYSSLPVHLCGDTFTLPQLQAVYEAVLGEPVNKVSFRRKMDELGMLEAVPGALQGGAHRPAQLYRLRPAYRRQLALSARGL